MALTPVYTFDCVVHTHADWWSIRFVSRLRDAKRVRLVGSHRLGGFHLTCFFFLNHPSFRRRGEGCSDNEHLWFFFVALFCCCCYVSRVCSKRRWSAAAAAARKRWSNKTHWNRAGKKQEVQIIKLIRASNGFLWARNEIVPFIVGKSSELHLQVALAGMPPFKLTIFKWTAYAACFHFIQWSLQFVFLLGLKICTLRPVCILSICIHEFVFSMKLNLTLTRT